jgi:hypothetical protein
MTTSTEVVFDLEADGLLDEVTKIHCLSYRFVDTPSIVKTLTDYRDIKSFILGDLSEDVVLIGHNIICYDLKAIKKILGVETKYKIIDTLPLSWYLNHDRLKHGLEEYGEEYGVPKPKITDWSSQTLEDYVHRCQEDTMINLKLWLQLKSKLQEIYS